MTSDAALETKRATLIASNWWMIVAGIVSGLLLAVWSGTFIARFVESMSLSTTAENILFILGLGGSSAIPFSIGCYSYNSGKEELTKAHGDKIDILYDAYLRSVGVRTTVTILFGLAASALAIHMFASGGIFDFIRGFIFAITLGFVDL